MTPRKQSAAGATEPVKKSSITAADPCTIVIFGASGDLSRRKLVPALYSLAAQNCLARRFAIIGFARTPMTDFVGALKGVSALDLGAIAARGAFAKTGVRPEWIEHVVFGNVMQTSADAIYGARHIALKAGDVQPLGPDAAREIGTFTLKTKSQPPQDVSGKYAVVWRKIGGQWLLVTDIWNSNK